MNTYEELINEAKKHIANLKEQNILLLQIIENKDKIIEAKDERIKGLEELLNKLTPNDHV